MELRLRGNQLRPNAWFGIVCAAALLAYARSFSAPFQFDDFNIIVGEKILQGPLSSGFFFWARTRIIPCMTFVLNTWLGGEDPFGYHVVNFAIHILTTWAVFRLSLAICRTPRVRATPLAERPLLLAVPAAFLFACHPIQIAAVTYIVQRMTAMAAMFYVGSVLLYIRARNAQVAGEPGRPRLAYAGSILFALAAFLSKENSASLPLAVFLAEHVFISGKVSGRGLCRLLPFLILVLVIPVGLWVLLGTHNRWLTTHGTSLSPQIQQLLDIFRPVNQSGYSPAGYFLTQCVVIPRYLRLVFLPWAFNVDHDIHVEPGFSTPIVAGMTLLALLLGFGMHIARRRPVLGFGILWLFVALSVESSFIPINDLMVEYRMYLAMPGVALAVASLFARAVLIKPVPSLSLGTVLAILLTLLTIARNEVWRTQLSLWQDALEKSPRKARVHLNLGYAFHSEGRLDEAMQHYCTALDIEPDDTLAKSNLNRALEEGMVNGQVKLKIVRREGGLFRLEPVDPCAHD